METQDTTVEAPEQTEAPFVDSRFFFGERVALPVGLTVKDRESVIETQLEAISPFSVDQLNYGAVVDERHDQAFVYAALKEQLELEESDVANRHSTFPSFVPFLDLRPDNPCVVSGLNGNQLSVLVFDVADALPCEVHSIDLDQDALDDERALESARDELLAEVEFGNLPVDSKILRVITVESNWKNERHFSVENGGDEPLKMDFKAAAVRLADVRDRESKRKSFQQFRLNQWLWWGTLFGTLGLVLVGILALFNLIRESSLESKNEMIAQRQDRVDSIEAKDRNLQLFESGSAGRLQPLVMLELANQVRPDGVYFSEVVASNGNQLQIEGIAENNGTALVNRFRSALEGIQWVESAAVDLNRINKGVAFFTATLQFKELEVAEVGVQQ